MSFRLNKWSVRWHIYRLARCCNIYVLFDVALKVAHKSLIITVIIMPFTFFVVVFTSLFTSYGSSNRVIDVSFTNGGSWIDSRCGFLPGRYPIFYHWFLCYYIHLYLYYFSIPFSQRRKKLLEKSLVTVGEGAMRRESVRRDSEQCTCLDLISWLQANCRNQSVPVDTNAFSFQNAYISMRSGVPSKLKCAERFHRKRSWKWIKTKTHRYRISADGRKRIKMKTMTSYVPRAS